MATNTTTKNASAATTAQEPLRAGTQTGSLINHLMSGSSNPTPEVGMGATILNWSDRQAATVVAVLSPTRIAILEDIATRIDGNGMSDAQEYTYAPGSGKPSIFTLRKNGAWVRQGDSMNGQRVALGHRSSYHDFSF